MAIRLLIADDDSLIRESLKIIIGMDSDFQVLGTVENGLQAVDFCLREKVDVAVLDVRMPVMDGVQAVKEITAKTDTRTLILTTFDDDEYIFQAVKNGAKGYLLKNNSPDKIKDGIRAVYNHNSVMQDVVMDKLREELLQGQHGKIDKEMFTQRELEVMELIAEGLSNKEISKRLFISEGTVKNYITNILDKTGLEHRTQIAIYYIKGAK